MAFYIFCFLLVCYLLGDKKPSKKNKNIMRKVERDIFISDVISGKKKL